MLQTCGDRSLLQDAATAARAGWQGSAAPQPPPLSDSRRTVAV